MAEFDGIREREEGKKRMPVGMTVLFIGLIVFGTVYMYRYTPQTTGWSQARRYEEKLREKTAAKERYEETHETAESAEHEAAEAKLLGQPLYSEQCSVCHGEKLEGGIGPALLGPKFIYGNKLEDHARVISDGTPNGMPAFGQQLGREKVQAVAQYIFDQQKK